MEGAIFECNVECADCGRPGPEWVSVNIGVVLCTECCGVHRGLGTHISKMRSLKLDHVPFMALQCILRMGGNERLNGELLERDLDGAEMAKIHYSNCSQSERSNFIKNKYTFKMAVDHESGLHRDQQQMLWEAVSNDDAFAVLSALYHGAEINHQFAAYNNGTALHRAVQCNHEVMVHLLVQNEVSANIEDGDGKLPNQLAIEMALQKIDSTPIQQILKHAVF